MFGLEYLLNIMRVLFHVAFAIVVAIPAHIAWNATASRLFTGLPEAWMHFGYKEALAFILLVRIVGDLIQHVTPKLFEAKSNTTNNAGKS